MLEKLQNRIIMDTPVIENAEIWGCRVAKVFSTKEIREINLDVA